MANLRHALATMGARVLRTRWLVRLPIWLYRARLGWVCGSRLIMLEHVGRRSGTRRYVVLEVVEHLSRDEYVVVSGFGLKAQWYRNIRANPKVRISSGFRRDRVAMAIPLTNRESADTLRRYAARHPTAWANLRATIEAAAGQPVQELPMVRLQLDDGT